MIMTFKIPKSTAVWRHRAGLSLHANSFEKAITDKEVTFDLSDVWYIPTNDFVKDYPSPPELNNLLMPNELKASLDVWGTDWSKTIGFKLPENKLGIDYLVVNFVNVRWSSNSSGTWKYCGVCGNPENNYWTYCKCQSNIAKSNDASNIVRKTNQDSHNKYFPGYLPSN